MARKGLSFKRHAAETGLRSVGNPNPPVDLKIDGKVFGRITGPNWQSNDDKWHVRLTVKGAPQDNPNTTWRWIMFKATHDNELAAREWVKTNLKALQSQYDFHYFED